MLKRFRMLLPQKLKILLAKIISNNITGRLIAFVYGDSIPHRGIRIFTKSDRIQRKTVADIYFGIYERAEIDQVMCYLNPTIDVIELGGSIGVNSLHIRSQLEKNRRLMVVEADPTLVEILRINFEKNSLEENVTIINNAIDYSGNEYVTFAVSDSNLAGHVALASNLESHIISNIPAASLSELIKKYGFSEYALVSDIEGMEIPIFVKDKEALKNCKQIFLEIDGVEYDNIAYSVEDVINLICDSGFKVVDRYFNCVAFSR